MNIKITGVTEEERLLLLEAAWFSLRHNYEDFAQYVDVSDEVLKPLVEKLDSYLGES